MCLNFGLGTIVRIILIVNIFYYIYLIYKISYKRKIKIKQNFELCELYSKCGIEKISKLAINSNIIVSVSSYYSINMALNLYYSSLSKFNITNYIFISTDMELYNELYSKNINTLFLYRNYSKTDSYDHSSYNYKIACISKPLSILRILEIGFNILLLDIDIYFIKDPLKYFSTLGQADIIIGRDWNSKVCRELNTGTLYILLLLSGLYILIIEQLIFIKIFCI